MDEMIEYDEDGNLDDYCIGNYHTGELMYRGHYRGGVMVGYWEEFYPDGSLWNCGCYNDDGDKVGYWEFFNNFGEATSKIFYF